MSPSSRVGLAWVWRLIRGVPGRPRWGLRTLGFLSLAFLAVVTSQAVGGYSIASFGCLVMGLGGAGYATVKGMLVMLSGPILPQPGASGRPGSATVRSESPAQSDSAVPSDGPAQSGNGDAPSGSTQS